jgi:predicted MFS family arabinose efflux permease
MSLTKQSKLRTLAVCLGYSIALIPGNTSPLIVGGLIAGLGLGVAEAGLVLSCELIIMGITATGLAYRMTTIDARIACVTGAVFLLLGHGLATIAGDLEQVILFRSLAGIGAGTVLASVNATIAASPNPPRLYGMAMMAPPSIGFVIAFFMSRGVASFAHAGAFGVLALLTLAVIPFLFSFPDYRKDNKADKPVPLIEFGPGIALMLAILIAGSSMMAYFTFVERLGVRLQLSIEEIGNIFAWVVLGGALGAGMAAVIENRFGLVKPLMIGILLHSICMIVTIQVVTLPAYIAGSILEGVSSVFVLTLLFALAASLDRFGRWAAAAGGAFSISLGIGPYLGGVIIEFAGFAALSVLIVICTIIIFFLLWWIVRHSHTHLAST